MSWLQTAGIPLVRRFSGGGAVYHDLGNSLFSFLMPRDAFTRDQHAHMLVKALQGTAALSSCPADTSVLRVGPRHDIFWNQSKISGSAYRMARNRAYHHGTMLLGADLMALEVALQSPVSERCQGIGAAVTSVRSPVTNLPLSINHDQFCAHLVNEYHNQIGVPIATMDIYDESSLARSDSRLNMTPSDHTFIREQCLLLRSSQWTLDKTPPFKLYSPLAGAISVEGGLIVDSDDRTLRNRRFDVMLFSRLFPPRETPQQLATTSS